MGLTLPDSLPLDFPQIDGRHAEFIALLQQLDAADKKQFPVLFQQLLEHTEQHFDEENVLMERFGFPAMAEHKGEHHRVLAELRQFKKRVDKGLLSFGYAYIRERLPQWFELHTATMDSALVAHIKSRQ